MFITAIKWVTCQYKKSHHSSKGINPNSLLESSWKYSIHCLLFWVGLNQSHKTSNILVSVLQSVRCCEAWGPRLRDPIPQSHRSYLLTVVHADRLAITAHTAQQAGPHTLATGNVFTQLACAPLYRKRTINTEFQRSRLARQPHPSSDNLYRWKREVHNFTAP